MTYPSLIPFIVVAIRMFEHVHRTRVQEAVEVTNSNETDPEEGITLQFQQPARMLQ